MAIKAVGHPQEQVRQSPPVPRQPSSERESVQSARTTLPPDAASAGVARQWARTLCESSAAAVHAEVVALLVTELVTNAVLHGRSDVTVELRLASAATDPEQVRILVGDDDSRLPRFEQVGEHALGGRGLRLVQGLADRVGVQERPIGKVVWCALDGLRAPEPYPPQDVPVPAQDSVV